MVLYYTIVGTAGNPSVNISTTTYEPGELKNAEADAKTLRQIFTEPLRVELWKINEEGFHEIIERY